MRTIRISSRGCSVTNETYAQSASFSHVRKPITVASMWCRDTSPGRGILRFMSQLSAWTRYAEIREGCVKVIWGALAPRSRNRPNARAVSPERNRWAARRRLDVDKPGRRLWRDACSVERETALHLALASIPNVREHRGLACLDPNFTGSRRAECHGQEGGCPLTSRIRFLVNSRQSAEASIPMAFLPSLSATTAVVPLPTKGSSTVPPRGHVARIGSSTNASGNTA